MKILLFLIIVMLSSAQLKSQSLLAVYDVSQNHEVSPSPGTPLKIITLNYKGYLYKKDNKYIYFEKPAYKQTNLLDGALILSGENTDNISLFGLNHDSIQSIIYTNFDSLVQRMGNIDATKRNFYHKIEQGWWLWKFLPDKKIINGLNCQKATYSDGNGIIIWSVWVCPDIPFKVGVSQLYDLPGLVVDAENIPLQKHYLLISQAAVTDIPDTIFWPNEFNTTAFTIARDLKKRSKQEMTTPTKSQKRDELLKNNH
ncbi:MAG: GLPGLI family protein [Ferruginibacter sp.]